MSSKIDSFNISEPFYYHREYGNDVANWQGDEIDAADAPEAQEEYSWTSSGARVAVVALPFIALYKPVSFPLSLAMSGLRVVSNGSRLVASFEEAEAQAIAWEMLQTAVVVVSLVGTIFAHPLGMLISTGHDILIEVAHLLHHLQEVDVNKSIESCLSIINNALYLALFLQGGLELGIVSLAMQVLAGLYRSLSEFQKGNYLEGAGHLGMALVRGNQLHGQLQILQMRLKIENLQHKLQRSQHQSKRAFNQEGSLLNGKSKTQPIEGSFEVSHGNNNSKDIPQDALDALIKYGSNGYRWSALNYAITIAHDWEAAGALIDAGIGINSIDSKQGHFGPLTPAISLINLATHGHSAYRENGAILLRKIIDRGIDISLPVTNGLTQGQLILGNTGFLCAPHLNKELELFLSKSKIDVNLSLDHSNQRAIQRALQTPCLETLEILLKFGARVNDIDCFSRFGLSGYTAHEKRIIDALINHGANPFIPSDFYRGMTAIDCLLNRLMAFPNGPYEQYKREMIPYLVSAGAVPR